MTVPAISFADYPAIIDADADDIIRHADANLDEPVPTCPGWTVADLLEHLGDVYKFWTVQVEAGNPEARTDPPTRGLPPGGDVVAWFGDAADFLVDVLSSPEPNAEDPCWNWSGRDRTLAWVARRMALETAVHRFDLELATGTDWSLAPELAADGIDEWLSVHLATDVPETPGAALGGVLCLACDDVPAAWTVEVGGGKLKFREGRAPADAVLVGTASDLYLYSWNRVPIDRLQLTGSEAVALAWSRLVL